MLESRLLNPALCDYYLVIFKHEKVISTHYLLSSGMAKRPKKEIYLSQLMRIVNESIIHPFYYSIRIFLLKK